MHKQHLPGIHYVLCDTKPIRKKISQRYGNHKYELNIFHFSILLNNEKSYSVQSAY